MTRSSTPHSIHRAGVPAVLASTLLVVGLTACGPDSGDTADDAPTPTTAAAAPSTTERSASTTTEPAERSSDGSTTTTAAGAAETTVAGDPVVASPRGEIVELTDAGQMSRDELQALIDELGIPGLTEAEFGLDVWRLAYTTVGVDGGPTVATGTIVVPSGATGPLPVVSDQHGTQTRRPIPDAPLIENEIFGASLLFASQGSLVVGADYLGLGESSGIHPYYDAESEASATLDMLRASRRAVEELGVSFGDELFLTGYSQGAHVTMALHRAIESGDEFEVTASAPMAGAYDLDTVSVPTSLRQPAPSTPLYLAYVLVGLDQVEDVYDDPAEVFQEPYASTVEELFDGTHPFEEIAAALPADPALLVRPEVIDDLIAGRGPISALLRTNNVYDWAPRAPVRLFHGGADADVPFRNAEVAAAHMSALGAEVEVVNVGDDLDHATAAMPAYFAAAAWFAGFADTSQ